MVKEGENFLCIKDVVMNETNEVAFTKGEVYTSQMDKCLTNNQRNPEHYVCCTGSLKPEWLTDHFQKIADVSEIRHHEFPKNGVKESLGKLSYELDFDFITQMAERMDANKGKYEPYNWQKPIDTAGLHRALARHFFQVMKANYEDEGRECGHLEALALNAMMINYQLKNHRDDTELEAKTDQNMNLISAFADHFEAETGKEIPDEVIYSFFNA